MTAHRTRRIAIRRAPVALAIALGLVTAAVAIGATHPLTVRGALPQPAGGAFRGQAVDPAATGAVAHHSSLGPPVAWSVVRSSRSNQPLIATTLLYPDPRDRRAFVGAAWLSPRGLALRLVPGTEQPGGTWSTDGAVPASAVPTLAAVFNAGFKYKDITGGFEAEGRVAVPLVDGMASLVIRSDGTATVGAWGTSLSSAPDVVAVRQNLDLIVAHSRRANGLLTNHDGSWSTEHHQVQRTPRSGIGQLRDGSLVYLAGPDLDIGQLADAFVAVGAVNAMQLDIHPNQTVFHIFDPSTGTGPAAGHELLDVMTAPLGRYLVPDTRDFVIATER